MKEAVGIYPVHPGFRTQTVNKVSSSPLGTGVLLGYLSGQVSVRDQRLWQERRKKMQCASRPSSRRHDGEDSRSYHGSSTSSTCTSTSSTAATRGKQVNRECAGDGLRRELRRGEEAKAVGSNERVRTKRRFKVSGTMFEASLLLNANGRGFV